MVKAITVSDHLKNIPARVRPTVSAARKLVRAAAPKAEEVAYQSREPRNKSAMWKLARYDLGGENVAGLGTFASYAALFFYRGRDLEVRAGCYKAAARSRASSGSGRPRMSSGRR